MRKFQRAAVVAAAVAGLSALGIGVSFAGGYDDTPPQINAVANSSANAVATWGGYFTPQPGDGGRKDTAAPEEGYGQYSAPSEGGQQQQ
ncbi:hypothetical protein GCM10010260_03060 [Streptomyces filipinensis]|uniref:Secreted protein n=1 Tax=Streptomyces filipinensis TaxID=66887 RepID=A0A918I4N1_9ACTN|nr:hypothetical protein [Streptomyces filipinensis]GGU74595.1 hypothetical protein GCM10010260_03060 [Streptomyces filipinensis]